MVSNPTPFEAGLDYFGPQMPGRNHFDFSPLFEFTILSILPSSLLLLVLPFRLRSLHRKSRKVSQSLVHTNKLTLLVIFTALQAAVLILYAINSRVRTPTSLAATALILVDALGLCLLSHAEHVRTIRPSTIINTYLLVTLLFDIAHTRTLWMQGAPTHIAAVFTIAVAVKLAIAVMESIEKRRILLSPYQNANPETISGIYSRAFFWWLNTIMTIGFRRIIRADDLFPIEGEMSSSVLGRKARKIWVRADKTRPHALFWSTLRATRRQLALCIFPRLCLIAFRYTQPLLLSRTADFVRSSTDTKSIGWGLTGAYGIVFLGTAIANGLYTHMTFRFTTVVRGTLVSMICAKTVELSITSLDESAAITLMANDTETICNGFQNLHEIWAVPIELGISMWLMQRELGLSFIAPAAVAILSMLCIIWISAAFGRAQKLWNEGIQTRVDITTTMLGSMKAVKMLGFTPKILEIVQGLRVNELKLSIPLRRLLATSAVFTNNMRILAPFVTFLVFALIQDYQKLELTAATAFTGLSLITMLSNPVNTLLRAIPMLKAALACFGRIEKFLESPSRKLHLLPLDVSRGGNDDGKSSTELTINTTPLDPVDQGETEMKNLNPYIQRCSNPTMIEVHNASFAWTADSSPTINSISFSVLRKSFVFIIGPVGCGKSTLLKGLMSETPFSQGVVHSDSLRSAFVDQTPWIQNTTIRQNIIGPSALNVAWYEEVVRACALDYDIAALPDSHDTVVGSRGISLSGGQKQRVALARMLYARSELMIIDDGFSGLDAHTEEFVFTKLFGKAGLLRQLQTTVILVTNAVHRLPYADHIISLDASGRITEQGSLNHLRDAGGYVEGLETKRKYESDSDIIGRLTEALSPALAKKAAEKKKEDEEDELNRSVSEWSTYKYYLSSIGWSRALLSLSYITLSGMAVKLTELVLSYWTSAVAQRGNEANRLYISLYGMLAGVGTVFWNIAVYHFFLYVIPGSAQKLHAGLLQSVMNAPLYFFTSTDTGTTTNRFSQDMSVLDQELPFALVDLIVSVVQTIMGAVLMCLATGYFALTLPPVIVIVWVIQKYYLRTSRQVRLLDLEAKSPLFTHFIESLSGLITIRSFGWSEAFVDQNLRLLDNSQKPYYLLFCIQRWLSIVLDIMVAILAVILMVLIVELRDSVGPNYVGLALLNVMSFSSSLTWIVKQWTALETSIGAVSRLKKFTTTTPTENLQGENQSVPDHWPTQGAIDFKTVSASYFPSGIPVLKDINMSIKPGERIGVCGRTGSGKSSLIMTLLRLLEITPESSILIDNVDIAKVPRQTVRSRINAIPQDSFFMKGSIRFNVSPDNNHNDHEIINALRKVHLWSLIESKGGLNSELDADYFSPGQQQLFGIARAILRKGKIVVMDEISSSIDTATDKLIQKVIREEFDGATIITVAHRLDTILDYDRIALLSDGELVEFDRPQVLLNRQSAFRDLYNSQWGL